MLLFAYMYMNVFNIINIFFLYFVKRVGTQHVP